MIPNFPDVQFKPMCASSPNVSSAELQISISHEMWSMPTSRGLSTLALKSFLLIDKHQEVYSRGPTGTFVNSCNFLFTGSDVLGLMTYPLTHLCFLSFWTWHSTPSRLLQIFHLWWLIYVRFSRSCWSSTQFPVFGSLSFPPPQLRQSGVSSSPNSVPESPGLCSKEGSRKYTVFHWKMV